MTEQALEVSFEERAVGSLILCDNDRLAFEYEAGWLSAPDSFPLSLSLGLDDARLMSPKVGYFFGNLLPEGEVRELVTRRLGISADNDFELLSRIGGDCAGAISISPPGEHARHPAGYRPLTDKELASLELEPTFVPLLVGEEGVRLSLAGAQDKLPVKLDSGQILVPLGSAPSTHILKLPSSRFKHLTANEVLVTALARHVGLIVVDTNLISPAGALQICVVLRYDRVKDGEDNVRRLHQEDLCQALGFSSRRKYEAEGGPSFATCYELVTRVSVNPLVDGKSLIDWLVFNAAVGNCDGHAKNLSLRYEPSGGCTLASFYDLVSTRAYPRLSRAMAMSIGGEASVGQLRRRHWLALADSIGVGGRFLLGSAEELTDSILESLDDTAAWFLKLYPEHPVTQLVVPVIRKQARLVLRSLRRE